jgi:hypothetical protein
MVIKLCAKGTSEKLGALETISILEPLMKTGLDRNAQQQQPLYKYALRSTNIT